MQVKDALAGRRPEDAGPTPLISSGREVLPALGLAWANCVNTRIFLSRHAVHSALLPADGYNHQWGQDTGSTAVQRAMQVGSKLALIHQGCWIHCSAHPVSRSLEAWTKAALSLMSLACYAKARMQVRQSG